MNSVVIIGYGSMGKRHADILQKKMKKKSLCINKPKNKI